MTSPALAVKHSDDELLAELCKVEETALLELLAVTSEDLVAKFTELILEERERFVKYLEDIEWK